MTPVLDYRELLGLSDAEHWRLLLELDPEGHMPIQERITNAAAFVLDAETKQVLGTAFAVSVTYAVMDHHRYWVTAHHVVDGHKTEIRTHVVREGRPRERAVHAEGVPIGKWYAHPDVTADIAVAPFSMPPEREGYRNTISFAPIHAHALMTSKPRPMLQGEQVYYVGLLGLPDDRHRSIQMVRSGIIGAWDEKHLWGRTEDGTRIRMSGHILDARSTGGFSGAPCFATTTSWRHETKQPTGETIEYSDTDPRRGPRLIGVILAGLDMPEHLRAGGLQLPTTYQYDYGVAIAAPVERIVETLDKVRVLVDEREKARAEMTELYKKSYGEDVQVRFDGVPPEEGGMTENEFFDALRKASQPDEPPPDEASE